MELDRDPIGRYRCPRYAQLPQLSLYMDQVLIVITDALAPFSQSGDPVTSTMINNYVKQKLIDPPEKKKYSRAQIADLIMIFILKRELAISEITSLMRVIKEGRSMERAYDLFCERLEYALRAAFLGDLVPEGQTCPALDAALAALANKTLMQSLLPPPAHEKPIKEKNSKK